METITNSASDGALWKEIEVSESYLVCSTYDEAASLSSSILKRLRDDYADSDRGIDMLESTAMVLIQAFKQLGRAPEIFNQLRSHFVSLKAIPPRVLLTGACFQIAEGSTFGVREFLEEFLIGWGLGDAQYDAVIAEANAEHGCRYERHFVLGIDEYLEVAEVYAVTLLATVLKDVDLAIAWVENAPLPEENQQGLLRRLHSMHSLKSTVLSRQSPTNNNEAYSLNEGLPKALKGEHPDNKKHRSKGGVSKLSERIGTCFWCFRAINLKFGTSKFAIPGGKIMLGCLILFVFYVFKKKQATLKRIVRRQVIATKRALVDLWQLAFSYQVNPLTAVHPLSAAAHQDTESLLKFKESLQNANALSSWNNASSSPAPPPCTDGHANWQGVVCYRGHVWGLQLEKMGLKGAVDVDSLKDLPYLRTISLMHNDFDTEWPQLNKLMGLKTIYLSNNKFSGDVPPQAFQGMQWLKRLHLSNNHFTGPIPSSLASLPRLMDLRLDGNKFTGPIPQFGETTIKSFSVANNRLEGEIPASLSRIPASSFSGNEGLCGAPLGACSSKHKKSIDASAVVAVVLVSVAVLVIAAVILLLLVRRRRKRRTKQEQEQEGVVVSRDHRNHNNKKGSDEEESGHSHDRNNSTDNRSTTRSSASSQSSSKNKGGDNSSSMRLSFVREDAEQFDLQELLRASAEVLGSGCYSSSYKAALLSGPTVVVKRFRQMNNVGRGEFQEHMRRLGRLTHPNLLPLLAYYYRKEEKLLVTDFVHNGSLAVRLHGHQAIGQPSLDWASRLKIVKGIARGVEYLYREMPSLIAPHGHLKSSNVLLTESLEPVLNDYGLVPMINQDLAPDIMVIYKSPEYLQNGRISKKTDVWGLGILILEILTGKFPAILQQGKQQQGRSSDHLHEYSLATWVESVVPDADQEYWRSSEVFDREMEIPKNSEGEMVKLLKVALACCEADVERRWDLKEAVDKIQEVREREREQRDIIGTAAADQDDFYSSYASEEADTRPSSRALSSEEEVS